MPASPDHRDGHDVPPTSRAGVAATGHPGAGSLATASAAPLPDPNQSTQDSLWRRLVATVVDSRYHKYLLTGWGISILLHIIIWPLGTLLLLLLTGNLPYLADTEVDPIRAALADEDRDDEEVDTKFEGDAVLLDAPPPVGAVVSHQDLMPAVDLMDVVALDSANNAGRPDADNGAGLAFRIPKNGFAVSKGSFTAWTEPAHPNPGQDYSIVIQIRLPDSVKRYRASDLSGSVQGTDNYRRRIPYDEKAPYSAFTIVDGRVVTITGRDELPIINNQVQLAIKIPGAGRLVQDTIQIRSRTLRERQTLEITFGRPLDTNNGSTDKPD